MALWHVLAVPLLAAAPHITPADGTTVTDSTVTVTAQAGLTGGTLYVDGVARDSGRGQKLTYTFDGHAVANGAHTVRLAGLLLTTSGSAKFQTAVPAYAPDGVGAIATGGELSVVWKPGPEPDLSGYTVTTPYGTVDAAAGCADVCRTTIALPKTAQGQVTVSVVARRAGAADSGASTATLALPAPAAPAPGGAGPAGNDGTDPGADTGADTAADPGGDPQAADVSPTPGTTLTSAASPESPDPEPTVAAPMATPDDDLQPDTSLGPLDPGDPLPRLVLILMVVAAGVSLLAFGIRRMFFQRDHVPAHAGGGTAEPEAGVPDAPAGPTVTPVPAGDDSEFRQPWT